MPPLPGPSPTTKIDASGPITLYTDQPSPHRAKLPIRSPRKRRKRPPSPSSTLPFPSLKKTRYHPDLTLCHACKRRTTPSKPLRPLPSQWRVALLCCSCIVAIRAGDSCSYCFVRLGIGGASLPGAGIVQCRRCRSRIHLACVPRMRGYASLPHDLDPHLFTCVDCAAVPDFFRAGESAVNRVSLVRAERASRSAAAVKAEEAARARSRPRHKADAASCAVVLARFALDSALFLSETCAEQPTVEGGNVWGSFTGDSSPRLPSLRRELSDLRMLDRELFVPGEDGYATSSIEMDRPSGSGDTKQVRGEEVIKQMVCGGHPFSPQTPPSFTYSRRRCTMGRSRGKLLFLMTYSLKKKATVAMEKGGPRAAGEKECLAVDGLFLRAEVESDHVKSEVPDRYSKRYRRKPRSGVTLQKELDEHLNDKKGYAGITHPTSQTKNGYLNTRLKSYKLVSSHDKRELVGNQSEEKPEQHSAYGHEDLFKAPNTPNRYLLKYSRKLRLNGLDDGAKTKKTKSSGMPDRYFLKYSRKNGLKSNPENEQVVPHNGSGNHWFLSPCTAFGNADAPQTPQEPGRLALNAANGIAPFGSLPLNEKL